jgi:hypothetical protein
MTDVVGSIQQDEPVERGFEGDEAVDAFLANLTGEETPPRGKTEAPEDKPTETGETEGNNTEGEQPDPNDPDEQEIDVKVGDENKKAKLKDLKRLYGQEASLTQKSQKASETLKQAEGRLAQADASLKAMLERAEERAKPYQELDWIVLSQRMDTESLQALRADAAAAEADVKFMKEELGKHMQGLQETANRAYQEAAQACLKTLQDPTTGIKDWNKDLFDKLCNFAADNGVPNAKQNVDPAVWKILHMAYQHANQKVAAETAEKKVTTVRNKPTTVLAPKGQTRAPDRKTSAMQNLRKTGSLDDAVSAFMAGMPQE